MTDAVIDRLNSKKLELEERLAGQNQQWGSQRRETLQYKIKKIEELITSYQSTPSPINLVEAKEILDQQVGFEEQKKRILESLEIESFREYHNVRRNSLILCLVDWLTCKIYIKITYAKNQFPLHLNQAKKSGKGSFFENNMRLRWYDSIIPINSTLWTC